MVGLQSRYFLERRLQFWIIQSDLLNDNEVDQENRPPSRDPITVTIFLEMNYR
jgi:hypothetical protein